MPIVVACPECAARVTAPDSAAGKRVKCPECRAPMILPEAENDFEVVEDTPRRAAPRKPAVVVDDADEPRPRRRHRDEDDEEDDRPRKKKKASSKGFLSHPAVLIVGGLLGVGAAAGGLYLYWEMKKKNAEVVEIATNAPFTPPPGMISAIPDGWLRATVANSKLSVVTPAPLELAGAPPAAIEIIAGGVKCWQATRGGKTYQVVVLTPTNPPPQGTPPDDILDRLSDDLLEGGQISARRTDTLGDAKARHCVYTQRGKHGVLRVAIGAGQVYFVSVIADAPFNERDRDVAPFFDTAQLRPF